MLRFFKNCLRVTLPPTVFLLITAYFAWNAVHGTRGLKAQGIERAQLTKAKLDFASIDADRASWETRIAALSNQSIAPDMLDDQARQVLSMAQPSDLVVKLADETVPAN